MWHAPRRRRGRKRIRAGEKWSEHEAIEFVARKFSTSHQFYEIDEVANIDLVRNYADTCFNTVGNAGKFHGFLASVQGSGIQTLATGYSADGLISDLPDHSRVTREIQHKQPERMLFELRQLIFRHRIPRAVVRRFAPGFLRNSHLYAYYMTVETISSNDLLLFWFGDDDLIRVNDALMIADDYVPSPFGEVDALRLFLLSYFNKIGMHAKQRIEKACRMTGLGYWTPYWDRDVMETALAIPIEYRNKEHSKYLSRRLVEKHAGPEAAFRTKYGFSRPFWPIYSEALDHRSVILEGNILDRIPWRSPQAKVSIRSEIASNHRKVRKALWPLYWLEQTCKNWDSLKLAR